MAGFSERAKNDMLNSRFVAGNVYVALFNKDGEVAAAEYSRQQADFSVPEFGQTVNQNDIFFPVANTDWGVITEVGLYDIEAGGNLLAKMAPEWMKLINPGSQYHIPEGMAICRLI